MMRLVFLAVSLLLLASPTTVAAEDASAVPGSQARWELFKPDQISGIVNLGMGD